MKTAFITGANRGLGLEFVRQLTAKNYRVFAGCRRPDRAGRLAELIPAEQLLAIDISDPSSINTACGLLLERTAVLSLLINNAGIGGEADQSLEAVDYNLALATFKTNTLGPLQVTRHLLPALTSGTVIANISSRMGSVADNGSGGYYGLRLSKAALNMVSKNISLELAGRGIIVLNLHPGWVRTDMGGPDAPLTVSESIAGMLQVIDQAGIADSGKFIDYRGNELPW
ncbi:MAG: SDR family oxidoreductase [Candidatus Neomarinimicrobiota bacterium]